MRVAEIERGGRNYGSESSHSLEIVSLNEPSGVELRRRFQPSAADDGARRLQFELDVHRESQRASIAAEKRWSLGAIGRSKVSLGPLATASFSLVRHRWQIAGPKIE